MPLKVNANEFAMSLQKAESTARNLVAANVASSPAANPSISFPPSAKMDPSRLSSRIMESSSSSIVFLRDISAKGWGDGSVGKELPPDGIALARLRNPNFKAILSSISFSTSF